MSYDTNIQSDFECRDCQALEERLHKQYAKENQLQQEHDGLKKENENLRRMLDNILDKINREKKAWDAEHNTSDTDTTKAFIRGARCSVNEIKEFVDNLNQQP